jgi:hypothetical protein
MDFKGSEASRTALEAFRAQHRGVALSGELSAGQPVNVLRLDRPGMYLLVPIRDTAGLRGIVQLDAAGLQVDSSAAIRDPSSIFLVSEEAALAAAQSALPDKAGWAKPFLGWRPCRQSFDSMRPLWVVPHQNGHAYVTQGREVFETLTAGRGG